MCVSANGGNTSTSREALSIWKPFLNRVPFDVFPRDISMIRADVTSRSPAHDHAPEHICTKSLTFIKHPPFYHALRSIHVSPSYCSTINSMRTSTLLVGLCASLCSANIIFNKIQPSCNSSLSETGFTGCLKGQVCRSDNMLVSSLISVNRGLIQPRCVAIKTVRDYTTASRIDGRCGPAFEDASCSANILGPCCGSDG